MSEQATKKRSEEAKNQGPAAAPSDDGPPGGFLKLAIPEVEGWFKPKEGLVLYGKLIGAFTIKQYKKVRGELQEEIRDVLVVGLLADTMAVPAKARKNEDAVLFKRGQVIGLGARHKLTPLLSYTEHNGVFWLKCLEKEQLQNGNTLWSFDLRIDPKATKSAPPAREVRESRPAVVNSESSDIGDDNLPF